MRPLIRLCVAAFALACARPAFGQMKTFGSWIASVNDDKSGAFAGTVNDSGVMLVTYCYLQQNGCIWSLIINLDCKQDASYPVLINSDAGAVGTEVVCRKVNNKPGYVFQSFDLIDGPIRNSKRIGIATPLQGGQFNVSRFSLDGAAQALDALAQMMTKLRSRDFENTADQTL